jgi:hypothetical protein
MTGKLKIECRAVASEDHNFILSAWYAALRNHEQFFDVEPDVMKQELASQLKTASAVGIAEADVGDGTKVLLGCLIMGRHPDGDIPIIKFAYTKKAFRRFGVFTALLEDWYGLPRGSYCFLATQTHMSNVLTKRVRFVFNSLLIGS